MKPSQDHEAAREIDVAAWHKVWEIDSDEYVTASTVTNYQIRAFYYTHPELRDDLMIAIHSIDLELRALARAEFARLINASKAPKMDK